MENKKAQLKIQEMAFMLVAVALFFVLVGLFVLSVVYSNLQEEATRIAEARTLSSITNLADSPEFSCVGSKSNCVDADKLIALINYELSKRNYENFWPFTSLKVVKMSAFDKTEEEMVRCSFANYPDCDLFVVYDKSLENERAVSSYVALCRKEYENAPYDKCEIAKLIAGSEIKIGGEK